jgi:hypothetical protein
MGGAVVVVLGVLLGTCVWRAESPPRGSAAVWSFSQSRATASTTAARGWYSPFRR